MSSRSTAISPTMVHINLPQEKTQRLRDIYGGKKPRTGNQSEMWESHDILFVTKRWHGYSVQGSQMYKSHFFPLFFFLTFHNSINKIYKIFLTISYFSFTRTGTFAVPFVIISVAVISLLFVLYASFGPSWGFCGADLQ